MSQFLLENHSPIQYTHIGENTTLNVHYLCFQFIFTYYILVKYFSYFVLDKELGILRVTIPSSSSKAQLCRARHLKNPYNYFPYKFETKYYDKFIVDDAVILSKPVHLLATTRFDLPVRYLNTKKEIAVRTSQPYCLFFSFISGKCKKYLLNFIHHIKPIEDNH